MLRHVALLLALFTMTLAACGCSEHPTSRSRDENTVSLLKHIDGVIFESTETLEVGLGKDGEVMGQWFLSFNGPTVTWDFSDTRWSGPFAMAADGTISASVGARQISGAFDPKTRIITWDHKQYRPVTDGTGG